MRHHTKDVWKSITTVDGELCVMTILTTPMLESLATVLAMGEYVVQMWATVIYESSKHVLRSYESIT